MKTVAIMVENSRAYGRAMIEGIAAYAQETRDWILRPLAVENASPSRLRDFDGIIARIADDRLAERLACSGIPVVDVFCQKVRPSLRLFLAAILLPHVHSRVRAQSEGL